MSNYFDSTPQGIQRVRNSKCDSFGLPMSRKCSVCKEFKPLDIWHKRKPAFVCSTCAKEIK